MSNYDLTSGDDVVAFAGTTGNTVTAADGTLTSGDQIDAGYGSNALICAGAGTFDLTAPLSLTGVTEVDEEDMSQTVLLRAGLSVAVVVGAGGGQEVVTLANIGDSFDGGSTFANTVYGTAAQIAADTLNAGASGANSQLVVTTGAQVLSLAGGNVTNFQFVALQAAYITFDPAASGIQTVYMQSSGQTVTLNDGTASAVDYGQNNTIVFSGAADSVDVEYPFLTGMNPPPGLATLIDFAAGDSVQIGALSQSYAASAAFDPGSETVTVSGMDSSGDTITDVFQLKGNYADDFSLAPTAGGTGYTLTYGQAGPSSTQTLTSGDDTVGAGISLVIATDSTLTSGDAIAPDAGSTLELVGGGTFDLTQPATLSNIATVNVDAPAAVVTLRAGLNAAVTLSSSGDDTVTLADDGSTINANGGANDVFNVNADQAANATITAGPFSTLNVTSGSTLSVTVGAGITGIQYLGLFGTQATIDPGASGATLVYLYNSGGGNTALLEGSTTSAIDYAQTTGLGAANPDNIFLAPGAGDQVTIEYANAPTENLYGLDSTTQVFLSAFASASVASASNTVDGAPGTLVTVSGTDASGAAISQAIQLYGVFTGTFSVDPVSGGSGYVLTFSGASPYNTLTEGPDDVGGVSDVYAATNTIYSSDVISTTPGGTLHLVGAGTFQLNDGATISGVTTIDAQGQDESIAFGTQAVTVNVSSAGHDFLQNLTSKTVIDGGGSGNNEGRASSSDIDGLRADLGSSGNNSIDVQDAGYALTLNNANLKDVQTFSIQGTSAITFDTGTYEATSGQKVNVDIADGGDGAGFDTVRLRGAGEQVTDYYGGNDVSLLAEGQTINVDTFGSPKAAETVSGFDASDTIALPFENTLTATPTVNFAAGTTTLLFTGTQFDNSAYSQSVVLNGIYGGVFTATHSTVFSDGYTVTYMPCYAEGARIAVLRADGTVAQTPVEELRVGDAALVRGGRTRPVVWIGSRLVEVARHPDPDCVAPVRIEAEAVAPGLPVRALTVSPDHAVLAHGVLVLARMLVNGASVRRLDVARVRYFHVELDAHDLLIAEGLPAESYLDTGNRAAFGGQPVVALHPDFAPGTRAAGMPVATDEAEVRPVWERVAARAGAAGHAVSVDAADAPALIVGGRAAPAMMLAADRIAYALPSGARTARLVCAAARPSDARPWLDDRRRLGAAIVRIEADGEALALDGPALGAGWHDLERDGARRWRWSDGDGAIALPAGASLLTVTLVGEGLREAA